ncbi:MAG: hypothetical protein OHK0017_07390 [Patescibacteria group bacterium]
MTLNPYKLYQAGLQNPKTRVVIIVLTLIYIITPIDLFPEIILPFVGYIDDTVLLTILITELFKLRGSKEQGQPKINN